MRLLGAALLIFSGLLGGMAGASRLRRRVRLLLDWKRTIQSFQTGIRYRAAGLSELILEQPDSPLCQRAERHGVFLTDPAGALEQAGEELLWDRGDRELYRGFVRGLGVSDTQGQLEHLRLYQELLEPRLEDARSEARQKSRVFLAVGLFAGVTLCLLLL